jgi:hypothetical protein
MLAHTRWFGLLALISVFALSAPPARSQCLPDGLDGVPCCNSTQAVIPQIPGLQRDAAFICYDGCQVSQNVPYCVNIGPPIPMSVGGQTFCGAYNIRVRLRFCGTANFVWLGYVNAFYTRNWQETPAVGQTLTVWRFVINGDMLPTSFLPAGLCNRPSCLSQFTRVYFSGYIDYALDCATGAWQVAMMLSHECDSIHHAAGTARPAPAGGFHPTRSFTIVAPGATFVPSVTGPMSDGSVTAEAIRWNNWAPAPAPLCTFEEPVNGGFFAQNQFCFCTTASASPQYISTLVDVVSTCGSQATPSPIGPFMQKRIGGWTAAASFPGLEFVLFDFGFLNYRNGCTALGTQEWFEGGETIGGYPAHGFTGLTLAPEFEDLGSCNNSTINPAVKIGAPHVSNFMMYLNLP